MSYSVLFGVDLALAVAVAAGAVAVAWGVAISSPSTRPGSLAAARGRWVPWVLVSTCLLLAARVATLNVGPGEQYVVAFRAGNPPASGWIIATTCGMLPTASSCTWLTRALPPAS